MTENFSEDLIFELDPSKITVREDLPRYRRDSPKIEKLLTSMEKFGQFIPIIITRDHELAAGGRRLAACLLGGRKVRCIYKDMASPLQIREIELEENIQREAYTPADEADAIADLHRIKQALYGESQRGREGGWKLDDTADAIGKTKGTVIENIQLSEALKNFPELRNLKTRTAIKKAVRGAEKVVFRATAAAEWEEILTGMDTVDICNENARTHMLKQEDHSINILLTDPPYGIEIDKIASSIDGTTGGISATGYKFDDSTVKAIELYNLLAKESFRFCTKDAHAYIFVAPEFFRIIRNMFVIAGWQAYIKPIIWIKQEIGQTNIPERWPASCYEMILYCRKDNSRLVQEGMPDWIQCDPVLPGKRKHPTEKPTELLINLLRRSAVPGNTLYDPFMGSGATIEAGTQQDLICKGCDKDINAYNAALERLSKRDFSERGKLYDEIERMEERSRKWQYGSYRRK